MRRILTVLMLIFTAWVVMPEVGLAHEVPHDMPVAGACSGCADMEADAAAPHGGMHDCHHGAGCFGYFMLVSDTTFGPAGLSVSSIWSDHSQAPKSAHVARDLPPPRT